MDLTTYHDKSQVPISESIVGNIEGGTFLDKDKKKKKKNKNRNRD